MPANYGIGFDDLQRVQNARSQRVNAKTILSKPEKTTRRGDLRRSTDHASINRFARPDYIDLRLVSFTSRMRP
jgi:hypothetical protein